MRVLLVAVIPFLSLATAATAGASPTASDPSASLPRDTVGGHVAIGVGAGLALPFGSLETGSAQTDLLSPGLRLAADVTYGVSRSVMLGVYGEWAHLPGSGPWRGDSATAIAAGPLVRYHLAQGVRFDPWVSYGLGFRSLQAGGTTFTGLDWARLSVGGDWYPFAALGFGPFLDLSLGTFFGGVTSGKAVNAVFTLGGRLVFDAPGK